jgi:deoxyribonuclease-2
MNLSAMDNNGKSVDWWFMYKISGRAKTKAGKAVPGLTGAQYMYYDSSGAAPLTRSPDDVTKNGALPNTLNQLYTKPGAATEHLGWFFYNDENPITGQTNGERGHTKGVLAFDLGTNTAFWLVQSTPKFPPEYAYGFPNTGLPNAQTLLCITLQDATVSQKIANQMFAAQQPNVYLASPIPSDLVKQPQDPRYELLHNNIVEGNSPATSTLPFLSKGGVKFISIAKNKYWGLDFYNDLVGPALHDNLDVETWTHGKMPPSIDSDKVHTVVDMTGIDLNPLGYDIVWPESDDHAKLAISARSEETHFICVGDINFTLSMRKRSGGTVAFQCDPLWQNISDILTGVTTHLKTGSVAANSQIIMNNGAATADPAVKVTAAAVKAGRLGVQPAARKNAGRALARERKRVPAPKKQPAARKAKRKSR